MATVLVVDDIPDYCDELAAGLSRDGHSVQTATSGQEAILLGSSLRPQVLLTDWMLNDTCNGLDVADILCLVYPHTQTIVMTGFASEDLSIDIEHSDVFDFVEKPFHLGQIRDCVRRAAETQKPGTYVGPVGVMEVEVNGRIRYMNERCQEMMTKALDREDLEDINQLFGPDGESVLEEARRGWREVNPYKSEFRWHVRGRPEKVGGAHLYVLLKEKYALYKQSSLVFRLLGLPERSIGIEGHILLVDDLDSVRRVTRDVLRKFSTTLHTANSHSEAMRLFVRDPDIRYVILDYDMENGDPQNLVENIHRLQPGVCVIGTSAAQGSRSARAPGIRHFLAKPWNVQDLMRILEHESAAKAA